MNVEPVSWLPDTAWTAGKLLTLICPCCETGNVADAVTPTGPVLNTGSWTDADTPRMPPSQTRRAVELDTPIVAGQLAMLTAPETFCVAGKLLTPTWPAIVAWTGVVTATGND